MYQQHGRVVEMEQQVFGPPLDTYDVAPDQTGREIPGHGQTKIAPAHFHANQAPALENRDQAAANGFDFGQFGHAASGRLRPWRRGP